MALTVPFYRHSLDQSFAKAVADVLNSPFLTSGAVSKAVEAQLCDFFQVPHALLMSSWTNGALATLLALGIGPGDEVIVPAMTFIATANVAEILGAKAVFVDVDPNTLNLTPDAVSRALTANTRAVIPVHLYGQMCDMRGLRVVTADRPEVAIIEDCAHSFESRYDIDLPGAHSDAALFSFYATKNISCGEGGAFITRRSDIFEKVQQTRLHGMSTGAIDRYSKNRYSHWDMMRLGTKANLPDLLAALLPRQIESVHEQRELREDRALRYEEAFARDPIRLVKLAPGAVSARHLFPIHVPPRIRDQAIETLNEHGIGATVNFRSVPTLSYYRTKYGYTADAFPVSHEWGQGVISLPMYPSLTLEEQSHVISTVRNIVVPMIRSTEGFE
jgi:dTDP-4-amino-4,6-dideoxygalactose transaminase